MTIVPSEDSGQSGHWLTSFCWFWFCHAASPMLLDQLYMYSLCYMSFFWSHWCHMVYTFNICRFVRPSETWFPWSTDFHASWLSHESKVSTPQPLIVGVQASFRVSYPNFVISRKKCTCYIGKGVLNRHLGSSPDLCSTQNCVEMNRIIKSSRYNFNPI